jgi:hypothetical protein
LAGLQHGKVPDTWLMRETNLDKDFENQNNRMVRIG